MLSQLNHHVIRVMFFENEELYGEDFVDSINPVEYVNGIIEQSCKMLSAIPTPQMIDKYAIQAAKRDVENLKDNKQQVIEIIELCIKEVKETYKEVKDFKVRNT